MLELSPLLSLGPGLEPTSISTAADGLTIHVSSTLPSSSCPLCSQLATRIHSRYTRVVADLPCAGQRVQLILHVRKFFCDTSECPRKIFAERLIPFVEPRARMTMPPFSGHPTDWPGDLWQAGRAPGRTAGHPDLLDDRPRTGSWRNLRRLRHPWSSWEWTISASGAAVRSAPSWWIWNGTRSSISCPTARPRQRRPGCGRSPPSSWSVVIEAATTRQRPAKARPRPSRSADRFHLMKNLTEAVGLALVRCWTKQQQERKPEPQAAAEAAQRRRGRCPAWRRGVPTAPVYLIRASRSARPREQRSMSRCVALQAQGLQVVEIARRLGKSRGTVRRWLAQGACPEGTHRRPRSSQLRCLRALRSGTLAGRMP